MKRNRLILLAIAALALASCGSDEPVGSADEIDGTWQLTSGSHAGNTLEPIATHPVTLEIDGDEVGGTAACNGYGGTIANTDTGITFSEMSITEMACDPPETMDLESAYMAALASIDQASIEGGKLVLSGPDTQLEFEASS